MKHISAEHSVCALPNKWQSSHWAPWVRVPPAYPKKKRDKRVVLWKHELLSFTLKWKFWNRTRSWQMISLRKLVPAGVLKECHKEGQLAGAMSPSPRSLLQPRGWGWRLGSCPWGSNLRRCRTASPWQKKLLMHMPGGIRGSSRPLLAFSSVRESLTWVRAIKSRWKQLFGSQSQNSQQAFVSMID